MGEPGGHEELAGAHGRNSAVRTVQYADAFGRVVVSRRNRCKLRHRVYKVGSLTRETARAYKPVYRTARPR